LIATDPHETRHDVAEIDDSPTGGNLIVGRRDVRPPPHPAAPAAEPGDVEVEVAGPSAGRQCRWARGYWAAQRQERFRRH
jgi:hypothetical protein